ncbi:MAG: NAD(P)H-hydrate dehydratase [Verrucomicrobiae bacterium]|nr:NAD(P)H-hydrate dehydratase [Verrucomicrobiae bacterium]
MSVPVISIAQMREWETITWATGQTEAEVIRRVGIQVAQIARHLTRSGDTILLLAGKGHNGDDVRAASEHLQERDAILLEVASPQADFSKLESALARRPALIIDGLFGIGLNRPLDVAWVKFIKRINQAQLRVLSVDVPSGLNADTGETHGAAIEATVTLTIGAPKPGMLRHTAWPYVGRLEVATEIGLAACPLGGALQWTLPGDFLGFPPQRPMAGHKGNFGHLAIIAGSMGYHGAAVLAARGAQRAQPGLVTLFTQSPVFHPVAAQLQSVMVKPWQRADRLPGAFSAILIGPGLAAPDLPEEIETTVRQLWQESPHPIIVDASALDWLPPEATPQTGLRVVTPHPGEAARLLKISTPEVQVNRLKALRELSRSFGDCWVVLKGHQTLIGRSEGDVFVNSSGNPHLAQGGSGDVLAGLLAGLLAQPALLTDPGRTLRYGVWQHGAAADALQAARGNWIVEELAEQLGNVR